MTTPEDSSGANDALTRIISRADAAGIPSDLLEIRGTETKYVQLKFQSGRTNVPVMIFDSNVAVFESIEFEKFKFVEGLRAIYSPELGRIEVLLEPGQSSFLLQRLHNHAGTPEVPSEPFLTSAQSAALPPLTIVSTSSTAAIQIGHASIEAKTLLRGAVLASSQPSPDESLSLTWFGQVPDRHAQTLQLIRSVGDSLLFQLDVKVGVGLHLSFARQSSFFYEPVESPQSFEYPKWEYDNAPMQLYWYARSARMLPLVQFLGYYQCIEHFYPSYAAEAAQSIIESAWKDPQFDASKSGHVAGLINRLRPTVSSYGSGSEKAQLLSVVNGCVNPSEVREFLIEESTKQYFAPDSDYTKVSSVVVRAGQNDSAILESVANRLYDIRCKVVHTKDGDSESADRILPFSPESELMVHDIRLAR